MWVWWLSIIPLHDGLIIHEAVSFCGLLWTFVIDQLDESNYWQNFFARRRSGIPILITCQGINRFRCSRTKREAKRNKSIDKCDHEEQNRDYRSSNSLMSSQFPREGTDERTHDNKHNYRLFRVIHVLSISFCFRLKPKFASLIIKILNPRPCLIVIRICLTLPPAGFYFRFSFWRFQCFHARSSPRK